MSFIKIEPVKTPIEELKSQIIALSADILLLSKNNFENIFSFICNNRNFTPQEVFDSFGTDAASLLISAAKVVELIKIGDPTYVPPALTAEFTINKDGTVTVK